MVKKTFLFRLALDLIAVGLVLVALAYYWLDNLTHEWIGTVIFLLVLVHNLFNRRWWATFAKARSDPLHVADRALTLSLLVSMLALLVTSVMISQTVFAFMSLDGGPTARQVHLLAAYWMVVFVSIHLGFRWQRVIVTARNVFNLTGESMARVIALRVVAIGISLYGLKSSFEMGVGSKLALQMSLEWWDFEASTMGFFWHWLSIVGLYTCLTHYVLQWKKSKTRKVVPLTIPKN